jgi:hypothetical protein
MTRSSYVSTPQVVLGEDAHEISVERFTRGGESMALLRLGTSLNLDPSMATPAYLLRMSQAFKELADFRAEQITGGQA